MGAKTLKCCSSHKSLLNLSKLLLNFLVNDPHKSNLLDFLNFLICNIFFLEISFSPLCYEETTNGCVMIVIDAEILNISIAS